MAVFVGVADGTRAKGSHIIVMKSSTGSSEGLVTLEREPINTKAARFTNWAKTVIDCSEDDASKI